MTETSSDSSVDRKASGRGLGWLMVPLSLFPLIALLTYDWRAMAALQSPPLHSANWIGAIGDRFAYYGYAVFGLAVWTVPAAVALAGVYRVAGRRLLAGCRKLWLLLFAVALACIVEMAGAGSPLVSSLAERNNMASAGGIVGYLLMTRFLAPLLGGFGASVLSIVALCASLIALAGPRDIAAFFVAVARWAFSGGGSAQGVRDASSYDGGDAVPASVRENGELAAYQALKAAKEEARRLRDEERMAAKAEKARLKDAKRAEKEQARAEKEQARLGAVQARSAAVQMRAKPAEPAEAGSAGASGKGPYILPPIDLLNPVPASSADYGDVGETSRRLIDTLNLFGIEATLADTVKGPVVTKYKVALAPGTRYSAVTSLSDNLMGALRAKSLRIEAPIPGEDMVGIEVPNRSPAGISFREVFESGAWKNLRAEIPLLFGKDAAGRELLADLASMPHMLVAGATGQGKSVCLNSLINGLLMTQTPDRLKLIMVDPKSVEFTAYASIPHLLVPVITENKKVVFALRWAVVEMEKRLKLFARAKVKNIKDFNSRKVFTQTDMFGSDTAVNPDMPRTVPYIVIIIDEVADLMAAAAKEVVPEVSRLTAKARAAGIHLILATQRPDAKVITGTIKANIPGRVAFKTSTSIDSRTILDDTGAENLIGRGDMLFKTKEGMLVRAQGALISDDEIARITGFIEQHADTQFDENFSSKLSKVKDTANDDPFAANEDDPDNHPDQSGAASARDLAKASEETDLYRRAIECIIQTNRASTSHFQRRLGIGYNNAARLCDRLEDAGVIGPQRGAGPREVLLSQEQLAAALAGGGSGGGEGDSEADGGEDMPAVGEDVVQEGEEVVP